MKKVKLFPALILITGLISVLPSDGIAQGNVRSAKGADGFTESQSKAVLEAYIEVKNGLVKSDAPVAGKAAEKLIDALGDEKSKLAEAIRYDAEHISEVDETGHQREHFESLSLNVYKMVKSGKANFGVIFWQYCPMALNNKGAYWLSYESEIRNPYFGDKMLRCGSVKETIGMK